VDEIQVMISYVRSRWDLARNSEHGASAVEYGLLVALIAAVIVGVVAILGTTLKGIFTNVNTSINGG
jgi:pilus assembly protein Flp/PilA